MMEGVFLCVIEERLCLPVFLLIQTIDPGLFPVVIDGEAFIVVDTRCSALVLTLRRVSLCLQLCSLLGQFLDGGSEHDQ